MTSASCGRKRLSRLISPARRAAADPLLERRVPALELGRLRFQALRLLLHGVVSDLMRSMDLTRAERAC